MAPLLLNKSFMNEEKHKPSLHKLLVRLKLDSLPNRVHVLAWAGTALIAGMSLIIFLLYKDVNVWEGWESASEFLDPIYAETLYPNSVFRTRMNTWSNLAYVLLGFYLIALGLYDFREKKTLMRGYLAHTPALSLVFGLACIYLGLGSGFFHASLTRAGQQCDVGGMYATMFVLGALCIGSWLPHIPKRSESQAIATWPVIVVVAIAASIYFSVYKWSYSFTKITQPIQWLMLAFVLVSLIQRRKRLQVLWFVAAVVSIVLAGYIRQMDIDGQFSHPDAIWQGHAIWHVITALFYLFLYLYFRSEERGVKE